MSARYWTQSFEWMIILSAFFGGVAGAVGTAISTLGRGWPTGPFIVVVAASFFAISLIFGKEKGILLKHLQYRKHKRQVNEEQAETRIIKKGVE